MEVKIQQMVKLDEDSFDEVLTEYLRKVIETNEKENYNYGPHPYVIEALKVAHDWFAMPEYWYYTPEQMEKAQKKFEKRKAKKK